MENVYDERLEQKRSQMLKEHEERLKMIRDTQNSSTQFYYDTTGNIDFGIPSDMDAKPQHIDISASSYIAQPEEKVEYGIPLRSSSQESYRPNLRNSDSQIDYGIPTQDVADMEKISIEKWQNERNSKFEQCRNDIISSTQTQYETQVELKENDFSYLVNGEADWALSKLNSLLHMPDNLELTQYAVGYLENLKDKPEYYNRIFSTILYDFISIKKKIIKGEHLQKYEKQQLFNSIKFFAIFVEKGYPINFDLFSEIKMPYQHNYGNYFHTEKIPYDMVIQQMIQVIEEKSNIIGNEVTNPINVVYSSAGAEKMKATELAKLALKAHYTNHKLSNDIMNFSSDMVMTDSSIQEFKNAREKQMQQDQIMREQQLANLKEEMVESNEGHSLK